MSGLFAAIILSFVASFRFSLSIFSLFAFFTSLVWCLCGNLPVFCSLFVPLSFLSLFLFVLIYLVQSLVTFFLAACLASLMRSSSFVLAFAFFYFFSLFDFVLFLVYLLSADRMSGLFTVYILPVFCAPCFVLLSLFSLVSLRLCLCRMSRAYLPLTCVHASYSLDSLHRSCSSVLLFDFSSLCESHSCELRFAMCLYVLCYLYNWKLFFGSFLWKSRFPIMHLHCRDEGCFWTLFDRGWFALWGSSNHAVTFALGTQMFLGSSYCGRFWNCPAERCVLYSNERVFGHLRGLGSDGLNHGPSHSTRGFRAPLPSGFFQILQFTGNFKGKPPILSKFWAQGPPGVKTLLGRPLTKILDPIKVLDSLCWCPNSWAHIQSFLPAVLTISIFLFVPNCHNCSSTSHNNLESLSASYPIKTLFQMKPDCLIGQETQNGNPIRWSYFHCGRLVISFFSSAAHKKKQRNVSKKSWFFQILTTPENKWKPVTYFWALHHVCLASLRTLPLELPARRK